MSKSKKLVLDVAALEEAFFEDCVLKGIRFMVEPYQFIWWLNKSLGTKFILNKQYAIENNHTFVLYEFIDKKNGLEHYLYTNRKSGNVMIRKWKGFNYLWLVRGASDSIYMYFASAIRMLTKENSNVIIQDLDLEQVDEKSYLII
jgi:hypothetical protein